MNPFSFIADITGGFTRSKALDDFINTNKEMRECTLKMLEDFQGMVGNGPYSKNVEAWNKGYGRGVSSARGKKFTVHLLETLLACDALSGDIEEQFEKHVPKEAAAEALDYKAANLVQYAQVYAFVSRYTRKLLLLLAELTSKDNPKGVQFKSGLVAGELKWMNDNVSNFYAAIDSLALVVKTFDKAVKEIPEIVVSLSDYEVQKEVSGEHKLDPWKMGFFAAKWNPIYHIRMAWTDYILARYEAAKAERQALEYRLMALKDSLDGTPNPKVEQAIKYHTEQLNKVNAKIFKVEESVHERA